MRSAYPASGLSAPQMSLWQHCFSYFWRSHKLLSSMTKRKIVASNQWSPLLSKTNYFLNNQEILCELADQPKLCIISGFSRWQSLNSWGAPSSHSHVGLYHWTEAPRAKAEIWIDMIICFSISKLQLLNLESTIPFTIRAACRISLAPINAVCKLK